MRRAALSLFGTLVLAILVANPAAASCTVTDGDVSLEICEDENGNGVPDHVSVDTPAGDATYHESACVGCPAPSGAGASAEAGDVAADFNLQCTGAPGQSNYNCWLVRVDAQSPVAAGWAQYLMGPANLLCAKVSTSAVAFIQCTHVPDNVTDL